MNGELALLRLLHIIPGAFWVGTAIFVAFILEPVVHKLGPQVESPLFGALGMRMGPIMTVNGLLTIIFGLVLVARTPGRGYDQLLSTGWGIAISIGLITAVIAFVFGLRTGMVAAGIGRAAKGITPGTPAPPDVMAKIEKLKGELRMLSRGNAVLVIIAVGTMASARFV